MFERFLRWEIAQTGSRQAGSSTRYEQDELLLGLRVESLSLMPQDRCYQMASGTKNGDSSHWVKGSESSSLGAPRRTNHSEITSRRWGTAFKSPTAFSIHTTGSFSCVLRPH